MCGAVGRAVGRSVYGHVITKFSRMGSLPHFFTHGAPLRALRARELRVTAGNEVIVLYICTSIARETVKSASVIAY